MTTRLIPSHSVSLQNPCYSARGPKYFQERNQVHDQPRPRWRELSSTRKSELNVDGIPVERRASLGMTSAELHHAQIENRCRNSAETVQFCLRVNPCNPCLKNMPQNGKETVKFSFDFDVIPVERRALLGTTSAELHHAQIENRCRNSAEIVQFCLRVNPCNPCLKICPKPVQNGKQTVS
jgi:hypothetical protein